MSLKEDVSKAMQQCDNKQVAQDIVEFWKEKKEKYTYSLENKKYYINSFLPTFPSAAWNRMLNGIDKISNYDKRVPLQADIVVTGECHCQCWHCFRSKYESKDMSLAKIKECIESLYKMGTASVGITGGEPMLRNDIIDIIRSIPDGMEGVLFTTGHKIDDEFASKIKDTNLTRCIISLDHFDEEVACRLRNNSNAFRDALQAIKILTENNIYTAVTVCVTNELLKPGYLEKYFELVEKLNVQEVRVVLPIPQGNLEGSAVGRFYGKAMGIVKQLKKDHASNEKFPIIVNFCEFESIDYLGCGAGSNYISINNDGQVTPCVAVPLAFGNVYEDSLENIYYNMGECFPKSGCVCFGIASGSVIAKEKIDTTVTPLPENISYEIARKCKPTQRADLFQYCSAKGKVKNII